MSVRQSSGLRHLGGWGMQPKQRCADCPNLRAHPQEPEPEQEPEQEPVPEPELEPAAQTASLSPKADLGQRAGLVVVRNAGPGRARRVSSSRSVQLVGWTVCLGRRAGLAVVRDTGPGHARQVSSSSSIQLEGWTACLGRRVGLAVVRNAGSGRARRPSEQSRPWPRAAGQLLKFHPISGLDSLPQTAGRPLCCSLY